jgi:uncharacterized protein (DUF1778 family)
MTKTVTIELPDGVAGEIDHAASQEGLTLQMFIARAAHQRARDLIDAESYFRERGKRADFEAFDRIMNRTGGEPPRPGDEIE